MLIAVSKCFLLFAFILPTAVVRGRILESEERETKKFTMNQATRGVAAAPFQFLDPGYYGNGCPQGSIEVIIPDFGEELTTVTILFSEYIASTSDSLQRDRKSCNIRVRIENEPGVSVGIFNVTYRGNAYVPPSLADRKPAYAKFDAEYFFSGQQGPIKSRTFTGDSAIAFEDNFLETDAVGAITWSACGATTNFGINTALQASKQNSHDEDVSIQLDSDDIHQDGITFAFTSRRC